MAIHWYPAISTLLQRSSQLLVLYILRNELRVEKSNEDRQKIRCFRNEVEMNFNLATNSLHKFKVINIFKFTILFALYKVSYVIKFIYDMYNNLFAIFNKV